MQTETRDNVYTPLWTVIPPSAHHAPTIREPTPEPEPSPDPTEYEFNSIGEEDWDAEIAAFQSPTSYD